MQAGHSPVEHVDITVELVRRLVAAQFPAWAELPIRPVALGGWDNRTFHLGSEMTVRLPSAAGYVAQVAKEHRWLPWLAPLLPLPIPAPLAQGVPSAEYPWPWSIYRWIAGEPAATAPIADRSRFATDVAAFLRALQRIAAAEGPPAGPHNFYRGGPLHVYDAETCSAIATLGGVIDVHAATAVWETALRTSWLASPVWIHGDVAVGNLLIADGRLAAVIDFGCMGVGDPACDLVLAWTFLEGASRAAFRAALPLDPATWARGRGWALWKALITLVGALNTAPAEAAPARRVVDAVLDDPVAGTAD